MFMKHYAPNRCQPSIEALNFRGEGDQGRCERRSEVFVKFMFFFVVVFFWGEGGGGHGRCEQRSEVFVKIQKKILGGGGSVGGGFRLGVSGWM